MQILKFVSGMGVSPRSLLVVSGFCAVGYRFLMFVMFFAGQEIRLLGGRIDLAFRIGSYITPVVKNLPLSAICSLRVAQRKFVYTLLCLSRSMWSTVCSGVGFLPWKAQHTRTWAYGDLRLRLTFRYPATFLRVNIFPVGALIRP